MKEDYLKVIEKMKDQIMRDGSFNWVEMCDILECLEEVEKILKK